MAGNGCNFREICYVELIVESNMRSNTKSARAHMYFQALIHIFFMKLIFFFFSWLLMGFISFLTENSSVDGCHFWILMDREFIHIVNKDESSIGAV